MPRGGYYGAPKRESRREYVDSYDAPYEGENYRHYGGYRKEHYTNGYVDSHQSYGRHSDRNPRPSHPRRTPYYEQGRSGQGYSQPIAKPDPYDPEQVEITTHSTRGRGRNRPRQNYQSGPDMRYSSSYARPGRNAPRYDDQSHSQSSASANPSDSACNYFSQKGSCKYGNSCRYSHAIRCIGSVEKAHNECILCCAIAKTADGHAELYTGSSDMCLKRWSLSEGSEGQVSINLIKTTTFTSALTSCLFYDDCLFCGFENGEILVFHRSSNDSCSLVGHTDPIYCLRFIENVLLSAGKSGKIMLWQFDTPSGKFNCIRTMDFGSEIHCIKEATLPSTMGPNHDKRYLWVGGRKLVVLDLLTLEVVQDINIDAFPVWAFVPYEDHMIAAFSDGHIRVYSSDGNEKFHTLCPPIASMDGILVNSKPLLICGCSRGTIFFIDLPSFKEKLKLKAHDATSYVKVLLSIGDGLFLSCGKDGAIHVWKHQ